MSPWTTPKWIRGTPGCTGDGPKRRIAEPARGLPAGAGVPCAAAAAGAASAIAVYVEALTRARRVTSDMQLQMSRGRRCDQCIVLTSAIRKADAWCQKRVT